MTKTKNLSASLNRNTKINRSNNKTSLSLLWIAMPTIIWLLVFSYLPMGGLIIAFKDYKYNLGIFHSAWNGLNNFKFLFRSSDFVCILTNTLYYNFIFIFVGMIFSVFVALLMDSLTKRFYIKVFQTTFFLPYFISWVAVAYIARGLLDYDRGLFNAVLEFLNMDKIPWYQKPDPWRTLIPIFNIWKGFGYSSLIYYGSIMSISSDIFEAARIDGCNKLKSIWYITLPHLKPAMIMMSIMGIGGILRADFGLFYQVPGDVGSLYPATDVIDTYMIRALITGGEVGVASAVGFFQSVVGLILVVSCNFVVGKLDKSYQLF